MRGTTLCFPNRFCSSCSTRWYMEERKSFIIPLPLLWYLYNIFWSVGKAESGAPHKSREVGVFAVVIGVGLPAMLQALSSSGTSIISALLITQPWWLAFFTIPWRNRRCLRIDVEKNLKNHVSFMQYLCMPFPIIILIVFYNFPPPFNPSILWVSMWPLKVQVSLCLGRLL